MPMAGDEEGRMRLGDVMQECTDGAHRFQCRECNKWISTKEATNTGGCSSGCCDDYKCPHCGHVTRIEWPD